MDEMTKQQEQEKPQLFNDELVAKLREKMFEEEGFRVAALSGLPEETVKWLWFPYIPIGKITIIQGDPGEGKTSFVLSLAARLSREGKRTVYITGEDGISDTIIPRLKRENADLSNILTCITPPDRPLTLFDGRFSETVMRSLAQLVILDPIQAFLGADVDMNRANEIRPIMNQLAQFAADMKCAIVLIGHLNKVGSGKAIHRGLGSIDLAAAARSVLLVRKDSQNPENRIVQHIKSSLAKEAPDAVYSFTEEGRLVFRSYNMRAAGGAQNVAAAIAAELYAYLKAGKRRATDLYAWADEKGISRTTLERARRKLDLVSYREGKEWYVRLDGDA